MIVGLMPAPGATWTDRRVLDEVAAYRRAFDEVVLLPGARWRPSPLARRCDVLRVTNAAAAPAALVAHALWGTPYVLQVGFDAAAVARALGRPGRALALGVLRRVACLHARAIIVTAHGLAEKFGLRGPKVHVIPNGVDLNRFAPRWPGPAARPPSICYVGRLAPEKNLRALVAAAPANVVLTLVGEGRERPALADLGRRRPCFVFLPGHVPYEDVPRWLHEASVFCLPSLTEGSPKALLEAMACGLPCVVSRRVPDIGRLPVLSCEPQAEDLREALQMALRPEVAQDLGTRARAHITEHHDLRHTLEREIDVVREAGR